MRSGTYPHPSDEFDAVARAAGPRGVHRVPRSRWSRWWPFLLVLVIFPALAYGLVTVLSDWDGFGSSGADSGTTVADDTTGDTGDPADEATPEETPAPAETTPAPAPAPAPPAADLTRPVEVYNATKTSGLARNGGDRLGAAGFTTVDIADWKGDDPAASIVYYNGPGDITTAQQAAAALGIVTVTESAELAPKGIVVVLAEDYKTS